MQSFIVYVSWVVVSDYRGVLLEKAGDVINVIDSSEIIGICWGVHLIFLIWILSYISTFSEFWSNFKSIDVQNFDTLACFNSTLSHDSSFLGTIFYISLQNWRHCISTGTLMHTNVLGGTRNIREYRYCETRKFSWKVRFFDLFRVVVRATRN